MRTDWDEVKRDIQVLKDKWPEHDRECKLVAVISRNPGKIHPRPVGTKIPQSTPGGMFHANGYWYTCWLVGPVEAWENLQGAIAPDHRKTLFDNPRFTDWLLKLSRQGERSINPPGTPNIAAQQFRAYLSGNPVPMPDTFETVTRWPFKTSLALCDEMRPDALVSIQDIAKIAKLVDPRANGPKRFANNLNSKVMPEPDQKKGKTQYWFYKKVLPTLRSFYPDLLWPERCPVGIR